MNERNQGAESAAKRLAFESQFSGLREVMEGITGTLPQLAGMANNLQDAGGWLVAFDIEPSQVGLDALVGLTETLNLCEQNHEQLGLPPFESLVFFAAGFLLRVVPTEDFEGEGLAVAPDLLARAILGHFEQCVAASEEDVRQWEALTAECIDDVRSIRPELAKVDPARLAMDLTDGENNVVTLFLDGRPVAQYGFEDGDGRLEWRRTGFPGTEEGAEQ